MLKNIIHDNNGQLTNCILDRLSLIGNIQGQLKLTVSKCSYCEGFLLLELQIHMIYQNIEFKLFIRFTLQWSSQDLLHFRFFRSLTTTFHQIKRFPLRAGNGFFRRATLNVFFYIQTKHSKRPRVLIQLNLSFNAFLTTSCFVQSAVDGFYPRGIKSILMLQRKPINKIIYVCQICYAVRGGIIFTDTTTMRCLVMHRFWRQNHNNNKKSKKIKLTLIWI